MTKTRWVREIHNSSADVEIGALLSYEFDLKALYRGAATYVDNLKTAKQIGLTIPVEVLARANKVIK